MPDTADRPLVWLDTETTRLDHNRRPWEVAAIVRQPGQTDTEHVWLIDADDLDMANADPKSLEFNRFWDRHPSGGKTTEAVVSEVWALYELVKLTKDAIICGSNPSFDTEMLAARMRAQGLAPRWHYHPEDVPSVARGWLLAKGIPAPRKSDAISLACGVDPSAYDRHTALGDCRWLRDLSDLIDPATLPLPA
ncbi:exonuclease domain-containing protein [Micromonospora echinospora]|uniref:3'-5' exonuclease n=1 Tax=Micromonospora echinospora TaxID=1877 RepID=UPI0037A76DB6